MVQEQSEEVHHNALCNNDPRFHNKGVVDLSDFAHHYNHVAV